MAHHVYGYTSYRFFMLCLHPSQGPTNPTIQKTPALATPQRPWSHFAVDFIRDLPESQGYTTILSVIDKFSKSLRLIPLPGLPTAFATAELLFNHMFRYFGIPEDIVSDKGTQFTSHVSSSFMEKLGISHTATIHRPMGKWSG